MTVNKQPDTTGFLRMLTYDCELQKIASSAASTPALEIGGYCWGFKTRDGTIVVPYLSLASEDSLRTGTNYEETVDYFQACCAYMYAHYGLEPVGRWHSHHFLGLYHPSGGDEQTGSSFASKMGIDPFIEIIVTLEGEKEAPQVNIYPYAYIGGDAKNMSGILIDAIAGASPMGNALENSELADQIIRPTTQSQLTNISWPAAPKPVAPPPEALVDEINRLPEAIRQKLDVVYDADSTQVTLTLGSTINAQLTFQHTGDDGYALCEATCASSTDESVELPIDQVCHEPLSSLFLLLLDGAFSPKQLQGTNH